MSSRSSLLPSSSLTAPPPRPSDVAGRANDDDDEEEEVPTEFTSVRVMWHAPSDYVVVSGHCGESTKSSTRRQCCYVRDTSAPSSSMPTADDEAPPSPSFNTIIIAVLMDRLNDTVGMLYDRVAEVLLQDKVGVGRCDGDLRGIHRHASCPATATTSTAASSSASAVSHYDADADSITLRMLPAHNRFVLGLVAEPSLALTADGEEADGFGGAGAGGASSTSTSADGANTCMNVNMTAAAAKEKRRALYGCVGDLWAARRSRAAGGSSSSSSSASASTAPLSIRPLRPLGASVGNALGEFEFPIIAAAHHQLGGGGDYGDADGDDECHGRRYEYAYFTSSGLFRGIDFDAPLSSVMRKGDTVSLMLL